jgi:branched-subunit amino acid ABC-type transport system permease component
VVATVLIIAALSMLCEEWIHWPLARKHSPPEVHFISSLGAFLVIVQSAVLMWGSDPRFLREDVEAVHLFQALRLTQGQIVSALVAATCLGVVFVWLRFSNMGLASRALASNADLLSLLGRNVRAVRRTVFAASGALVGIVSLTTALDVGYDPQTGMRAVLVGVAATIIGGRASFAGAAFAGFTIGVLRATVAWFFSARWEDPATMLAMAFTLFVFPGGLRSIFGPRERLEEEG